MKKYKAFTVVELLVVMILAGIVFLALFENVQLVKRYTVRMESRLDESYFFWHHYSRLESLFQICDSALLEKEEVLFYRGTTAYARLWKKDSLLLLKWQHTADTLFDNVVRLHFQPTVNHRKRLDTLKLTFLLEEYTETMTLGFRKRNNRNEEDYE